MPSTTVLAFDFGEKRIGVAVGDWELKLAHPLTTVAASRAPLEAIATLVKEWQPALLVVGLPAHSDGREHELAGACRRFAQRLKSRFHLPVLLVNETLSSWAGSRALREAGVTGKKQKPYLDAWAAQHILQSYLDEPHPGEPA